MNRVTAARASRMRSPNFEALATVEWDFSNRTRDSELEAIHPYPAKFIPDLPGTILDLLPIESGTAVLDPFVGSGTTLVECQKRQLPSVGIDLNPIACMISRVKTSPLPANFDEALNEFLLAATGAKYEVPTIPNLDHWFERPIQVELARLLSAIERTDASLREVYRLALSSILVRVSNQDSDTRYAAVKKNIDPEKVIMFFATACHRIATSLKQRKYALTPTRILERNTLEVCSKELPGKFGAVITSPPYPNAYEYWLYHKYRMFWLGYDPQRVKEQEIGARAHFFKKNHHTADDFVQQMRTTMRLIAAVLVPKGYACFVVGRSKIHGTIVDNAKIIEDVAAEFRFQTVFRAERAIAANRKSFNLSHAMIKSETVLVLTR